MSDKKAFYIFNSDIKANCIEHIRGIECRDKNPMEVIIKPTTRKVIQNDKMWAMLTDISKQVEWYGHMLVPEEWKDIMSASLDGECKTVPDASGRKLVLLGKPTSKQSVKWLSDMIEFMYAFGSLHNVRWSRG